MPNDDEPVPAHEIQVTPTASVEVEPEKIMARDLKQLRSKTVPMVQVKWKNHPLGDATWEVEGEMRKLYPQLFE